MPAKRAMVKVLWGLLVLVTVAGADAAAQDVYVVYTGSERTRKDRVVAEMPRDLSVKVYNADLLALADYSGKQKAVTKLSRASIVVVLGDKAARLLRKTKVKSTLLIVGSTQKDIGSTKLLLYVVPVGTDTRGLSGSTLTISSGKDLQDRSKLRTAKVLLVEPNALTLAEAVSLLARTLI